MSWLEYRPRRHPAISAAVDDRLHEHARDDKCVLVALHVQAGDVAERFTEAVDSHGIATLFLDALGEPVDLLL